MILRESASPPTSSDQERDCPAAASDQLEVEMDVPHAVHREAKGAAGDGSAAAAVDAEEKEREKELDRLKRSVENSRDSARIPQTRPAKHKVASDGLPPPPVLMKNYSLSVSGMQKGEREKERETEREKERQRERDCAAQFGCVVRQCVAYLCCACRLQADTRQRAYSPRSY